MALLLGATPQTLAVACRVSWREMTWKSSWLWWGFTRSRAHSGNAAAQPHIDKRMALNVCCSRRAKYMTSSGDNDGASALLQLAHDCPLMMYMESSVGSCNWKLEVEALQQQWSAGCFILDVHFTGYLSQPLTWLLCPCGMQAWGPQHMIVSPTCHCTGWAG